MRRRALSRGIFLLAAALVMPASPRAGGADPVAPAGRPEDVKLIAEWLLGRDGSGAFAERFGDGKLLADAKDLVAYSDVAKVDWPKGAKAVPYDFVEARMRRITAGAKAGPAVLVTASVPEDPSEGDVKQEKNVVRKGEKEMKDQRYYYVEVAIGNLAKHWMKVAVGESEGKVKAVVLWHKQS